MLYFSTERFVKNIQSQDTSHSKDNMARRNLLISKKENILKAAVRRLSNECSIGPRQIQSRRLSLSRVQDRDSIHAFIEERDWKAAFKMLRQGNPHCPIAEWEDADDEDEERRKISRRRSCEVSDGFHTNILLKACQRGAPVELINTIIILYPEMIKEVSGTGKTPLHAACDCNAPLKVIECLCDELLMESPALIIAEDSMGQTALDCAVKRNAPIEVISTVTAACILAKNSMARDYVRDTASDGNGTFAVFNRQKTAEA
jgi:hypothetical protein